MRLDQAARSIFLTEIVQAFFLSMRTSSSGRRRSIIHSKKTRYRRASVASMYCAAIPTARSAASPASSARRSVRRKPSPSRPARAGTTAPAVPPATTLIWSNASIAGCARRPAVSTPSSRVRTSNTPPKRARSFTTTRSDFWRTAIAGARDRQEHRARRALSLRHGARSLSHPLDRGRLSRISEVAVTRLALRAARAARADRSPSGLLRGRCRQSSPQERSRPQALPQCSPGRGSRC